MWSILVSFLFWNAPWLWWQQLQPVNEKGAVRFIIRNFGSEVEGSFSGLKGQIAYFPTAPEKFTATVSVNASSIETGNNTRNRHLKEEKYFNVEKHPTITVSAKGAKTGKVSGAYITTASVTIKGVTKNVELPFTVSKQKDGFLFEGKMALNRRNFGVGGNSLSLSDEVTVFLKVMAKQ